MRYEAHAYGTREEILATIKVNDNAARSPRRRAEAQDAAQAIESGATEVHFGKVTYHVTECD